MIVLQAAYFRRDMFMAIYLHGFNFRWIEGDSKHCNISLVKQHKNNDRKQNFTISQSRYIPLKQPVIEYTGCFSVAFEHGRFVNQSFWILLTWNADNWVNCNKLQAAIPKLLGSLPTAQKVFFLCGIYHRKNLSYILV